MDKTPLEEYKKGQKSLVTILLVVLVTLAVITGIFTNYKQETLVCSKSQDVCFIQKTNLANQKIKKELVKYSDIGQVSYMRQKVKGNRFAKGYSSYLLVFNLKNYNPVVIFSSAYFEKEELDNAIKSLNKQMKSKDDEIILNRD